MYYPLWFLVNLYFYISIIWQSAILLICMKMYMLLYWICNCFQLFYVAGAFLNSWDECLSVFGSFEVFIWCMASLRSCKCYAVLFPVFKLYLIFVIYNTFGSEDVAILLLFILLVRYFLLFHTHCWEYLGQVMTHMNYGA